MWGKQCFLSSRSGIPECPPARLAWFNMNKIFIWLLFFFFFTFIASSWLFCLFWDKLDRYSSKQSTCSKPPCFFSFMHTTTSSFKYNQQVFQSETNAKQCWGSVLLKDTVVEAQGHNFWRLWRNKPSTSWSRVQCFITALQLTLQTSWLLPSRKTGFAPHVIKETYGNRKFWGPSTCKIFFSYWEN